MAAIPKFCYYRIRGYEALRAVVAAINKDVYNLKEVALDMFLTRSKHFQLKSGQLRAFLLICLAFAVNAAMVIDGGAVMAKFDPMSFFEKNTTFFSDFKAFRAEWFAVENRISGIKDEYEPVDWAAIRKSAEKVVMEHERLTVKFARDSRSARSKLPPDEAAQAQRTIELVLEYLDSVGLVVLKLNEISEKLYKKTVDPYSYTMSDYNSDMRQFKKLYEAFEKKGNVLNQLLYSQ